jgi:hypothetical protein
MLGIGQETKESLWFGDRPHTPWPGGEETGERVGWLYPTILTGFFPNPSVQ